MSFSTSSHPVIGNHTSAVKVISYSQWAFKIKSVICQRAIIAYLSKAQVNALVRIKSASKWIFDWCKRSNLLIRAAMEKFPFMWLLYKFQLTISASHVHGLVTHHTFSSETPAKKSNESRPQKRLMSRKPDMTESNLGKLIADSFRQDLNDTELWWIDQQIKDPDM